MHLKLQRQETFLYSKNASERAYRLRFYVFDAVKSLEPSLKLNFNIQPFILQNVVHRHPDIQTETGLKKRMDKYSAALHVVRQSILTSQEKQTFNPTNHSQRQLYYVFHKYNKKR